MRPSHSSQPMSLRPCSHSDNSWVTPTPGVLEDEAAQAQPAVWATLPLSMWWGLQGPSYHQVPRPGRGGLGCSLAVPEAKQLSFTCRSPPAEAHGHTHAQTGPKSLLPNVCAPWMLEVSSGSCEPVGAVSSYCTWLESPSALTLPIPPSGCICTHRAPMRTANRYGGRGEGLWVLLHLLWAQSCVRLPSSHWVPQGTGP